MPTESTFVIDVNRVVWARSKKSDAAWGERLRAHYEAALDSWPDAARPFASVTAVDPFVTSIAVGERLP